MTVCNDCGQPASGEEFRVSGLCQRCLNGPMRICCKCGWDGTLYLHGDRWFCDDCEPKR